SDISSQEIVYIGIALNNRRGLKTRIKLHLNPNALEYRVKKQSRKLDFFQLQHAIPRKSKKTGLTTMGIDRSSLRKNIGRALLIKPGDETVKYITDNLTLEVYECENKNLVRQMEKFFIDKYQPRFNIKGKKS
ncbi:hypothetical protein, partial [Vibrio parahaemolyticus]